MASAADRDPRHHTQKMQKALQEIKDHLSEDIEKAVAESHVRNGSRGSGRPYQGVPRLRAEK
jgi:hypothetical protein